jgi:hypothetical protein
VGANHVSGVTSSAAVRPAMVEHCRSQGQLVTSAPMSVHQLKSMARKHWEEWLPEKVKELKAEGKLNEELHAAANLAQDEIETLMKAGYSIDEAREVALPMFILLPPEEGEPDEQDEELAEMEREYQKNPPPEVVADRDREREELEDPDYWKK